MISRTIGLANRQISIPSSEIRSSTLREASLQRRAPGPSAAERSTVAGLAR